MRIKYSPLTTHDIDKLMKQNRRKCQLFRGVFAADELKFIHAIPGAYIVNCDTSKMTGSHWTCIYFNSLMQGYYFDSFGVSAYTDEHIKFLYKYSKGKWNFNKVKLQSLSSSVCGQYCCLFTMFVSAGNAPESFSKKFYGENHPFSNDALTILNFTKIRKEGEVK